MSHQNVVCAQQQQAITSQAAGAMHAALALQSHYQQSQPTSGSQSNASGDASDDSPASRLASLLG